MTRSCPTLGHAHCLAIEGADARRFAQAQFSGNLDALVPGHWQWNAWLSPQGRVRALMHLVDAGDGNLLAVLRGGDAQEIRAALARFLLRARATLAVQAFECLAGGPAATGTAVREVGAIVLGHGSRSLRLETAAAAAAPRDPAARMAWRLEDIRRGWPTLPRGEPQFLPPALGLEHLRAVSFDKGCYPGQEIAARLRYRGGQKHRLYHLRGPAPPAGDGPTLPKGITCLDAVTREGTTDMLAVGPVDLPQEITVADRTHRVITAFDP